MKTIFQSRAILPTASLLLILAMAAVLLHLSFRHAIAAQEKQLFTPATVTGNLPGADDPGVVRSRLVSLDLSAMDRAAARSASDAATEVRLDLFDDVRFVALIDRAEQMPDAYVYSGRLKDVAGGFAHLAISHEQMTGSITLPNRSYAVRYAGGGLHLVQEINPAQLPNGVEPIPVEPSSEQTQHQGKGPSNDDGSLIDVMIVYTPAARAAAGGTGGMQREAAAAVAQANTAFLYSDVTQRFRLVHTAEVNYTESGAGSLDLSRLRGTSDGFMDGVHILRDTHGADLVTLIVNDAPGLCGVGYLMKGNNPGFAPSAFNVVVRSCATANYSFAHETGHNQGLCHARDDGPCEGAYPYSYGYKDPTGLFRDIMAYSCPGIGLGCPRIGVFSNPNVYFLGRPTGIPNLADCARSLNNTRVTVANFRPQACPVKEAVEGEDLADHGSADVTGAFKMLIGLRDKVFPKSRRGTELIKIHRAYAFDAARILLKHPHLRAQLIEVLESSRPAVDSLLNGDGQATLDADLIQKIEAYITDVAQSANPKMREDLLRAWRDADLWSYEGKPVREVLESRSERRQSDR